jgi:hypothetical protein
MRATSTRVFLLAALTVVLSGAGGGAAPELRTVVGNVEIGTGDPPSWHAARTGELLQPGDVLRTAGGARAEVETSAGTIRVFERSELRIPDDASSQVDLDHGASIFDVRHRSPGEPFEVHTPHAVVMVKGTRFTVSDGDDGASVAVQRGLVSVRDPAGAQRELFVHPGFGVRGGPGRSFTLGLMPEGFDSWDGWSRGIAPVMPSAPPRESRAGSGAESARAAARAAASQQVAAFAGDRGAARIERRAEESANLPSIERTGDSGVAAAVPASPVKGDEMLDDEGGMTVKTGFGEALLGGSSSYDIQVLKSGNQDQVHIVGTGGLDVSLTEKDLKQVINGNTSLLGPQLLGVLSTRGVSPGAFANQMLDLL